MRILFISNVYSPYHIGGAELVVENFAKELAKRHEVSVITTSPFRGISSPGIKREKQGIVTVYRFFPLNISSIFKSSNPIIIKCIRQILDIWNIHSYFVIRRILLKEKPDVIHIHCFAGFSNSIFTALWGMDQKVILSLHDAHLLCPKAILLRKRNYTFCIVPTMACKIYRALKKWFVKDIRVISFNSEFLLQLHKKEKFFTKARQLVLYPLFQKAAQKEKKYTNNFNILFVGRFNKQKGADILIEAFKRIDNKKISLLLIGKGEGQVYIRKLAQGDNRIRFSGPIPHEKMGEYYENAHIVVVPSRCFEGFSLVVLESFSYGVPVIASRVGALPELVQDDFTGLTFESNNSQDLQEAILKLVNNPALLRQLSQNIKKEFIPKFIAKSSIDKLEYLYHSLCQKKSL